MRTHKLSVSGAPPSPAKPQTYILIFFLFGAVVVLYLMRVNLSFAIDGPNGMASEYNWSHVQRGTLLSSFFNGYIVAQIPGGYASTKFGGWKVLLFSVTTCSLLTGLSPYASTLGFEYIAAVRVMLGLASGCLFPTLSAMLGRWITIVDRGRAYACADFGGLVGATLSGMLPMFLMPTKETTEYVGWPWMFNWPACVGLLWALGWFLLVSDGPETHTRISAAEREWILDGLAKEAKGTVKQKVPWKILLFHPALWAMYIFNFTANWTFYTLLTYLPQYMTDILNFDLSQAGMLFALPYLSFGIFEISTSVMTDFLVRQKFRVLTVRIAVTMFWSVPMLASFYVVAFKTLSVTWTIVLLTGTMAFLGGSSLNPFLTGNDLFPQSAGVVFGISNTLGTIGGIVSPILSGHLLKAGDCPDSNSQITPPESCVHAWKTIFLISACIQAVGFVLYFILIGVPFKNFGYTRLRWEAHKNLEIAPALEPTLN
eukprot:m.89445 g.89445  ORF g.89445 m.89445 type:complete len:485 (-) comp13221_c0_seq1:395-1849(-)